MSRKTSESRASRAAEMLRGSRRINDSTIRRIAEKTGLSDTIITEIAKPIRQAKAEQEAIDSAERTLAAAERRVRREQAPCPICNTGYAHPFDFDTLVRIGWRKNPDTGDRIPVSIWAHPYFCECFNRRCVARNIFPADSEREAVTRFVNGDFTHPGAYTDLHDGTRYTTTGRAVEDEAARLLRHYPAGQVKRLGFDPKLVDTLALQLTLDRLGNPDAGDMYDTTLICPHCGGTLEYREAVSPVTRRKDWWRCACRSCGRRDNGSHPSREEAREAFAGLSGSTGDGPRGCSLAVG